MVVKYPKAVQKTELVVEFVKKAIKVKEMENTVKMLRIEVADIVDKHHDELAMNGLISITVNWRRVWKLWHDGDIQ